MSLSFRLKVDDELRVSGPEVTRISHDLSGVARIEAGSLVLEWGGRRIIGEYGSASVGEAAEDVAAVTVRIPVSALAGAAVRGVLWFRNRLEITLRSLKDAPRIPGSPPGCVVLWISRSDRDAAMELAASIEAEVADHALRSAERESAWPGPG